MVALVDHAKVAATDDLLALVDGRDGRGCLHIPVLRRRRGQLDVL